MRINQTIEYLSFSTGDSGYYQKVWKSIVEISSIIYLSANINVNQFLPSTITIFIPTIELKYLSSLGPGSGLLQKLLNWP